MNIYLVLILLFLTGSFILDTVADLLNLSYLKKSLPQEFQGLYEPEKYQKHLHYQTEGNLLEMVRRTLLFIGTVLFVVLGGFGLLDDWIRSFQWGEMATALAFVGALSLIRLVFQMPFSIIDTFVIEQRYGFNKTTPATFVGDTVKGLVLSCLLGAPIFLGIVYFFETAGGLAWLYTWITITVFQLTLAYLAPAFILPLFNKFSPLPEGSLKQAIQAYADSRHFKLQGIFTMDSSKRSTKGNAFFTGFGKFRRLVLFDTLVEKHSTEELVAVLAHEIGHFERRHIVRSMVLSVVSSAILFYVLGFFIKNEELFAAFQMRHTSVYASILFFGFLFTPINKLLSIFSQWLSRKYEFEADAFAVETYGQPETLISALKKLSMDTFSHLTPHPLKVFLEYSHPPILERIHALRFKNRVHS